MSDPRWALVTVLSVGLGVLGAGCDQSSPERRRATSGSDESIHELYSQMAERYERMASQRGDPTFARQMHRQMAHMAKSYKGGMMRKMHGRMRQKDGRGMMEGRHRGSMHGDRNAMMRGMDRAMMGAMGQWHQRMAQREKRWATELEKQGDERLAATHREMAAMHQKMLKRMGVPEGEPALDSEDDRSVDGASIYTNTCASCHGSDGRGAAGAFPPLAESSIVSGKRKPLIQIVHDGLTGKLEVNGKTYDGVMPGFGGQLSDRQVAAVLTYIRGAWGNQADEVTTEEVREATGSEGPRDAPWRPEELGLPTD